MSLKNQMAERSGTPEAPGREGNRVVYPEGGV